jgi:hypothetical protein
MFDTALRRSTSKVFFLCVNLDNPGLTSVLAPILGQYGIKPSDFINLLLNDKGSFFFLTDTFIFLKVMLLKSGRYNFEYLSPSVNFLLKQLNCFNNDVLLIHLMKIILIKNSDINRAFINLTTIKNFFRIIINYIKSFNDKAFTISI